MGSAAFTERGARAEGLFPLRDPPACDTSRALSRSLAWKVAAIHKSGEPGAADLRLRLEAKVWGFFRGSRSSSARLTSVRVQVASGGSQRSQSQSVGLGGLISVQSVIL